MLWYFMEDKINHQRIRPIRQMLLEMAVGNFSYRIQRSTADDEVESLILLLNMVAEELKSSFSHLTYVNPHNSYSSYVQASFIVDSSWIVKKISTDVSVLLGYSPKMLYGAAFEIILSEESAVSFNSIKEKLSKNSSYSENLELVFVSQNQLLVPAFCNICRFMDSTKILISLVTTIVTTAVRDNVIADDSSAVPVIPRKEFVYRLSDVQLIQQVYDYILIHIDSPLPNLKELSHIFGTNEYKLKYGFKHLFKTTIYQFYNVERLKKAHLLIENTGIPLKEIAAMSGFIDYSNFSKAFRKSYGYAPNKITRKQ
ncbi:AraC family transcriptional regulator [Flavobacterium xinjiangense]|uniref:AraC-type DNA-binding protein n=1 Tax=Flavobacterium xinjiangense TaxID=178356 RepID=A0A1M7MU98_9FLAO|nr:AraC family transcriptional regulator [Flavobacterium xinjiangense]SHM94699.1 AraC-type DNA-binding protein [Flavobacterium xinjiangense]